MTVAGDGVEPRDGQPFQTGANEYLQLLNRHLSWLRKCFKGHGRRAYLGLGFWAGWTAFLDAASSRLIDLEADLWVMSSKGS
jgi:hypothetical protein